MNFREKYEKASQEKDSSLCISLDPALHGQRGENTMPPHGGKESQAILDFSMGIIEQVGENCMAIKTNSQYVLFSLSQNELKKLNKKIKGHGLISILDHKLSDIGSTNDSAMYWMEKTGFDAFTYAPYPGNIREAVEIAHKRNLGIFTLGYMSNPQAEWIQKDNSLDSKPLYMQVAEKVQDAGGDGIVVGATGHVTTEDVEKIRRATTAETIFLHPGIGAQGGHIEKIMGIPGEKIVNVGRAVIYSENPRKASIKFNELVGKTDY